MNLKTTATLLVLVIVVAVGWFAYSFVAPSGPSRPSAVLDADVKDALTRDRSDKPVTIEVKYGDQRVELERPAGRTGWRMPNGWATRSDEVRQLARLLAGLESRFVPTPVTDEKKDEKKKEELGLDKPAVTVTVRVGDKEKGKKQVLEFGRPVKVEKPGAEDGDPGNSFYQPVYVRLDDKNEAIRLAPGLVDQLRHPVEYYQQRWLFLPPEKQIQVEDAPAKADRYVGVKSITFSRKGAKPGGYTLAWDGGRWVLADPVRDRADPDKLKAILAAVPDLWAEKFVDKPSKDLGTYGLKDPEETLRVVLGDGRTVTLLLGKRFKGEPRLVMEQPPPFGQPQPPRPRMVQEEFCYARLQDRSGTHPQVFEVKADKLKDLDVAADTLRDPRLARFRTEDARKVEVSWKGRAVVLAKDKDDWELESPSKHKADTAKVNELLDKLSGLEARDKDIIDNADPRKYGLEPPAGLIRVTVKEEVKGAGDAKKKKTKVFRFAVGKEDAAAAKLYVRVNDWKRVNAVEDALAKLASRPALAYRGRQVLQFTSADLARIDVRRPTDPFTLERSDGTWRLTSPVRAEADSFLVDQLAADLGNLDAVEYVTDNPKPADLESAYGLGKSALSAQVAFSDAKKEPQTLLVGKQRPGKDEYFAKVTSAPGVFVVKKEIREALAKPSLGYRPLQLWTMQADDIRELDLLRARDPEYRLKRDGQAWRISGPFDAPAAAATVKPMADELANLRCERYVAHVAKDLASYGLDKPHLRVALAAKKEEKKDSAKAEKKPEAKQSKERVLLVGKPAGKKGKKRFAKLGDGEAVFVLGEKAVTAIDHGALDLLDRALLSLSAKDIQSVQSQGKGALTLERKAPGWRVVGAPAAPFAADSEVVNDLLAAFANLRAERFAAYGPKTDLAAYGLRAPAVTVTVTLKPEGKKTGRKHTLALGSPVPGAKGERYARLDQGPGVAVLGADAVRQLTQSYLDFVDRSVWSFDAGAVTGLSRRMGAQDLEIARRGDSWRLLKPADQPADPPTLAGLAAQLAGLRAKGVAAYPARDLKAYGLDNPAAVLTVRLTGPDKKPAEHVLKIGKGSGKADRDRYAVADKATAVFVLPGDLVRQLTAAPLKFRDRDLAHAAGVDKVLLKEGPRRAVFAKADTTWKMTEPLETEAEQAALEDFLKSLATIRADELVAEKPADLKAYGLDRPEASWQFFAGNKEVLGLVVGAREKAGKGPRRYAKLAKGNLVFLLDPSLTAQATGEYRSRTLWPVPPDAAQVEEVRFGYRENPFTLSKVDATWQVAGRPGDKVKQDAVADTLAALARLKAARYVVDKGADLKLYGLDQPRLVLEVKTPSGPKTLQVGNREGGSKRYYARVPDGDNRTAVFTLSEEDAAKIVRPLKDFLQAPGK